MKSICPLRRHRRGVALLTVLAVITLVVILLVSFLVTMTLDRKTTANYSQSIKAQEIGLGALQEIICDLKQEIAAGSLGNGSPPSAVYAYTDPVSGQLIVAYVPATNKSASPARIGYPAAYYGLDVDLTATPTTLPPTLVRVSRDSTDPFYTSASTTDYPGSWGALPPARATKTWTTIASVNGRKIAPTRWTKPMLLGSSTTEPSNFSTITTVSNADVGPPQWVYFGRSGSINTTTGVAFQDSDVNTPTNSLYADAAGKNANAILGRYAYVMYDEGALLDANVAGADGATVGTPPFSSTSLPLSPFRNKSYVSYADLTQIPGLTSTTAPTGQSLLTSLVNWRNQGGLAAWGNYINFVMGAGGTGFLTAFGPGNTGSTSAYPTTTPAAYNQNDNPFLSRQDLIDYFTQVVKSPKPLPYLGTFSRAVNAPSAIPNSLPTGLYQYAKYAEVTSITATSSPATNTTANRDQANVRLWLPNITTGTTPITITHYKDDGTTTNYKVDPGAPLLQRRFSLAKLAWIGYNGANSAAFKSGLSATQQSTAIQDCFGLVWDTTNNTWDYIGGTSDGYTTANPPSNINTLAQVATLTTPREPNFFELLKAGILNGSLGRDPGLGASISNGPGVEGQLFDDYSSHPDPQIIQIGANIIDQATTDDYPTAIYFQAHSPTGYPAPYYRLFDTAFGVKDLPYFYRMMQIGYTTLITNSPTAGAGTCQGWYQPELWNPHQKPSTPPTSRPTAFRVRAHGGANFNWHQTKKDGVTTIGNDQGLVSDPMVPVNYETNPNLTSYVYFTDVTGDTFREQPIALTTANDASSLTPSVNKWQSSFTTETLHPPANQFLGICAGGDTLYAPDLTSTHAIAHLCTADLTPTLPALPSYTTFTLEYQDSSGNWYPYALFSRFKTWQSNSATPTSTSDNTTTWPYTYSVHMDPRTDRFSGSVGEFAGTDTYPFIQTTLYYSQASGYTPVSHDVPQIDTTGLYTTSSCFFFYNGGTRSALTTQALYTSNWLQNQTPNQTALPRISAPAGANYSYYLDPDQVWASESLASDLPRPGDGYRLRSNTDDGHMLYHTTAATPAGAGNDQAPRRPLILNRPFRSVGELGYAFRDVPFKSLDFWSQYSADAALLDVFSVQDEPAVVAGQINPNNAPLPVLEAVLSGGAIKEIDSSVNYLPADLTRVATAIATYISTNGPLKNRADLVTAQTSYGATTTKPNDNLSDEIFTALTNGGNGTKIYANKACGEAPVRALSAVTNIRTWNLLIDVIAQSGHMIPNPISTSTLGNSFVVDGEKRYWLHIAIDRYTGQVIDEQLEPVYE